MQSITLRLVTLPVEAGFLPTILPSTAAADGEFRAWLQRWICMSTALNEISNSLGEEDAKDDVITAVLDKVNLHDIFQRGGGDLGKVVDCTNVLSLGEQQRVAFARLFLKKPAIAFLDEENERFLYEKLRESGIPFVSVGHRSTLKEFHDTLLVLKADGTSEITPLKAP